jgi:hypothetical protein
MGSRQLPRPAPDPYRSVRQFEREVWDKIGSFQVQGHLGRRPLAPSSAWEPNMPFSVMLETAEIYRSPAQRSPAQPGDRHMEHLASGIGKDVPCQGMRSRHRFLSSARVDRVASHRCHALSGLSAVADDPGLAKQPVQIHTQDQRATPGRACGDHDCSVPRHHLAQQRQASG